MIATAANIPKKFEKAFAAITNLGDRPLYRDFSPLLLRSVLSSTILTRVIQDECLDFEFRIIGDQIAVHLHNNPTHRRLSEIAERSVKSGIWAAYEQVVTSKAPWLATLGYIGREDYVGGTTELYIPLFDDAAERVSHIVVLVDFIER